jgi:hypothetical protein
MTTTDWIGRTLGAKGGLTAFVDDVREAVSGSDG